MFPTIMKTIPIWNEDNPTEDNPKEQSKGWPHKKNGKKDDIMHISNYPLPSAPTLISRPKSLKSRLNQDQNFKKTRLNPDPI